MSDSVPEFGRLAPAEVSAAVIEQYDDHAQRLFYKVTMGAWPHSALLPPLLTPSQAGAVTTSTTASSGARLTVFVKPPTTQPTSCSLAWTGRARCVGMRASRQPRSALPPLLEGEGAQLTPPPAAGHG